MANVAHQLPDPTASEMAWLEHAAWPLLRSLGPRAWAWVTARIDRQSPIDFRTQLRVALRGERAVVADLNMAVPAVSVWFEVHNHSDVDVILDRITIEVWANQPVLWGVMADRTRVACHSTVEDIHFQGALVPAAVDQIRKGMTRPEPGLPAYYTVHATAYFDSPKGAFFIRPLHLLRELPAG